MAQSHFSIYGTKYADWIEAKFGMSDTLLAIRISMSLRLHFDVMINNRWKNNQQTKLNLLFNQHKLHFNFILKVLNEALFAKIVELRILCKVDENIGNRKSVCKEKCVIFFLLDHFLYGMKVIRKSHNLTNLIIVYTVRYRAVIPRIPISI